MARIEISASDAEMIVLGFLDRQVEPVRIHHLTQSMTSVGENMHPTLAGEALSRLREKGEAEMGSDLSFAITDAGRARLAR